MKTDARRKVENKGQKMRKILENVKKRHESTLIPFLQQGAFFFLVTAAGLSLLRERDSIVKS